MARDRQESDSGGLGSPGISQEVFRWPGAARSRIVGAWSHLVSSRRFPGWQGRQKSDECVLRSPGG